MFKKLLPPLGFGALASGLLTAPLIGLMYPAARLFDLPFIPFAWFDWLTRVLPGPLVTLGIDLMIDLLRLAGLSVAAAAKTGEQWIALLLFWLSGATLGALYFAALPSRPSSPPLFRLASGWGYNPWPGLLVGALFGLPSTSIGLLIDPAGGNPVIAFTLPLALFLVWGAAAGYVYYRLMAGTEGLGEGLGLKMAARLGPERATTADGAGSEASATAAVPGMDGSADGQSPSVQVINRRQFLIRIGAATATVTVAGAGLGAVLSQEERRRIAQSAAEATGSTHPAADDRPPLPNADDPVTPAPGTRPEYTPVEDHYKVFLRSEPTFIDISNWILPITGLVANPVELTIDQIRAYPQRNQYVTLSCISGRIATTLISTTQWTGVSLQEIIAAVQPLPQACYLVIRSADGFYETVALDLIAADARIMLCYAWDGAPLPFDHGFPLRIWIPDRYGMKQPKWIVSMELTEDYRQGYWVERGWDETAQVQATSVIDTVAVRNLVEPAPGSGDPPLVPVGGIAFAGARGISNLQVRVDQGPWQKAQLRRPLSATTWVIWRYDWPFAAGSHRLEVRCAEGDGTPQIEEERDNRPSGATGIHRRQVRL